MAKKAKIDYRAAKIFLNKYTAFGFRMPRKGKDFTPAQKATITKKINELKAPVKAVAKETAGFLRLTKKQLKELPENFDYLAKTNKGIFTKFANPEKTISKKEGLIVKSKIGVRTEKFYPFPVELISMSLIQEYVEKLIKKYKPDYVRWSVKGYKGGELFSTETFSMYAHAFGDALANRKGAEERFSKERFFNGVFLGWLK